MKAPGRSAQVGLGRPHGLEQRFRLVGTERAEGQPLREPLPGLTGGLAHRIPRHIAHLGLGAATTRGPDDLVAVGHEPGVLQMKQAGQQLSSSEIAQRTEENDDMVLGHGEDG